MPLKLYRRGSSPNWYIRGTLLGRAVDQSAGTPERSVAEQIRIRIEQEIIERQIHGERGSRTFAEAAVAYVETVQPRGTQRDFVIGRQLKSGRASFNLVDTIGARRLRDIGPATVTELAVKHFGGAAPATINRNLIAPLSAVMRFAAGQGWCDLVTLPRRAENNARDRWLSTEEAETLLRAAAPHIRPLLAFLLLTGARMAEALELEWRDVDFERGFIHIRHPKGGKSQKIPLNDAARGVLEGHPHVDGTPYVFPGQGGKQRVTIQVASNRIKARAGLPADFRPLHGLRHLFASTLASSGQVDMLTLQKLLTHKSPQMTKRYSHLRDDALKQASEVAGNLLGNVGKPRESMDGKVVSMGKER